MAESYTTEHLQRQIRDQLNADKIKLWELPYTNEDGTRGEIKTDIIEKYAQKFCGCTSDVAIILEMLRTHALEKLAARKKFQASGIAELKVKLAGCIPDTAARNLSLEMSLELLGSELKSKIATLANLTVDNLKVISRGHILQEERTLTQQGIKHGSPIMAICLSVSEGESAKQQASRTRVIKAREAAELISSKTDDMADDDYYLQIADQTGKPLQLPVEEKKALTLAMTLHEKGRAALKRKEYGEAVLLLLEADEEFKKCRADILNAVDNYAVLCLDIVWCYFRLKNVDELPDAEQRLSTSEQCFHKSYGEHLERLAAVKGGSGNELALFMKLHLLQAVVAFHQHQPNDAVRLLNKAEGELKRLVIDERKLMSIMSMGFSDQEARLGLRSSQGDIEGAVALIVKKREEKKQLKEKEREEKRKKSLSKSLGKTANDEWVNTDMYQQLLDMGFRKGAAREALRQSNNHIGQALEVLQNHPDLLSLPDPVPESVPISDELIQQVISMGFQGEMARIALQRFGGSVQRAIEELIKNAGVLVQIPTESPSTSGASSSSKHDSSPTKTAEERQREKEAYESIIADIPQDEEDYLDLTLEEESEVLREYKTLLQSLGHL